MSSNDGDEPWYTRDRGRIDGPYTMSDLRRMAQTRRLARHHQVSADRVHWRRAADALPLDVFRGSPTPPPAAGPGPSTDSLDTETGDESKCVLDDSGKSTPPHERPNGPGPQRMPVEWLSLVPLALSGLMALVVAGLFAAMLFWVSPTDDGIVATYSRSLVTIEGTGATEGKTRCYGLAVTRKLVVAPIVAATLQGVSVGVRHDDDKTDWSAAHLVLANTVPKLCVLRADLGPEAKPFVVPDQTRLPKLGASLRLVMPDDDVHRAIESCKLDRIDNRDGPDELLAVELIDDRKDSPDTPLGRVITDEQGVVAAMVVQRGANGENLCVPASQIRKIKIAAAQLPLEHTMQPIALPGLTPRQPTAADAAPAAGSEPPETDTPQSTSPAGAGGTEMPQNESGTTASRHEVESLVGIGVSHVRILEPGLPELPPEKATELGRSWLEQIRRDHPICRDNTRTRHTRDLANELIRAAERAPESYVVTVVEDDAVNAYAFVGNNILVNTGFLDFAGSDTEMIQFVLAHELGHLVDGHVELPFRQKLLTEGLPGLGGLAGGALSTLLKNSPYNQALEEDADCFAVKIMRSLGKSPAGGVRFFTKVSQLESSGTGNVNRPFATLFRSHPDHHRRIEVLSGGCSP